MTEKIITVFKNSSSEAMPIFLPNGGILEYLRVGFQGSYAFQDFNNFYAKYSKIEFFDAHRTKLKKRSGFKESKPKFPSVYFLNESGSPMVSISFGGLNLKGDQTLWLPRGFPCSITVPLEDKRWSPYRSCIYKLVEKEKWHPECSGIKETIYAADWVKIPRPQHEIDTINKMIEERKKERALKQARIEAKAEKI